MTQEDYRAAKAALLGTPRRCLVIDGKYQPTSLSSLNRLAAKFGINTDESDSVELESTGETVDQKQGETPAVIQPPADPADTEPETTGETVDQKQGGTPAVIQPPADQSPATDPGDQVEIPQELHRLKLADLKALAAKLGIDPVPSKTKDLIDAIEARRGK